MSEPELVPALGLTLVQESVLVLIRSFLQALLALELDLCRLSLLLAAAAEPVLAVVLELDFAKSLPAVLAAERCCLSLLLVGLLVLSLSKERVDLA